MRSRGRWTSTCTTSRSARARTARMFSSRTSGPRAPRSLRRSRMRSSPTCFTRATARCSMGTNAGTHSRSRQVTSSPGTSGRRTCASRRFSATMPREPQAITDIENARVLAVLGDSVTTDHISPAGSIKRDGPAAKYLNENHVETKDFNSYGSRRGNHEVMMRGTFANIRLRNQLAPGTEGGVTLHLPDGEEMSIYDAAMRYQEEGTPLVVLAGKEYGSGSSRDWGAKGTRLLGGRAVSAQTL